MPQRHSIRALVLAILGCLWHPGMMRALEDPAPVPAPVPELAPIPKPPGTEPETAPPPTVPAEAADALPSSELPVRPDSSLLPEQIPADSTPADPADAPDTTPPGGTAPGSSLAPAPAAAAKTSERGPLFRVPGEQAWNTARALGYCFTPEGGGGRRDGVHTTAAQYPNFLTSEIHGTQLTQIKPPVTWALASTSNVFYLFCDASHNAVKLNPGWKIRGIQLQGPEWEWVACPRSGANTASFSVRLHARKEAPTHTKVTFAGLTLEGPPGAKDWRAAFPALKAAR